MVAVLRDTITQSILNTTPHSLVQTQECFKVKVSFKIHEFS